MVWLTVSSVFSVTVLNISVVRRRKLESTGSNKCRKMASTTVPHVVQPKWLKPEELLVVAQRGDGWQKDFGGDEQTTL
jgi:hypothetical protein